ncbi:MAG: hypothetical protein JW395_0417 [Nitrospira sp.]|nr:hypothetical protein [Nitrospira sp.]
MQVLKDSSASRGSLGMILSDATYTLGEFQRISGLGEAALRKARRQGLVVSRVGRRGFVTGRDFQDYLGALSEDVPSKPVPAHSCIGGANV